MSVNFCSNCGARLKSNANFCGSCGQKVYREEKILAPMPYDKSDKSESALENYYKKKTEINARKNLAPMPSGKAKSALDNYYKKKDELKIKSKPDSIQALFLKAQTNSESINDKVQVPRTNEIYAESKSDQSSSISQNYETATPNLHYNEDKTISKMFFSTEGRLSFKSFIKLEMLSCVFLFIIAVVLFVLALSVNKNLLPLSFCLTVILFFYVEYCLVVRRLKDMDKDSPGLAVLYILFMPWSIVFLMGPGTRGPNKYGPDPLENNN